MRIKLLMLFKSCRTILVGQWFLTGAALLPRGHRTKAGDIFGGHNWERHLLLHKAVPSGFRSGMLRNILHSTAPPPRLPHLRVIKLNTPILSRLRDLQKLERKLFLGVLRYGSNYSHERKRLNERWPCTGLKVCICVITVHCFLPKLLAWLIKLIIYIDMKQPTSSYNKKLFPP